MKFQSYYHSNHKVGVLMRHQFVFLKILAIVIVLSPVAVANVLSDYQAVTDALLRRSTDSAEIARQFLIEHPDPAELSKALETAFVKDSETIAFHFEFVVAVLSDQSIERKLDEFGISDYIIDSGVKTNGDLRLLGSIRRSLDTVGAEVAAFNLRILKVRRAVYWLGVALSVVSTGVISHEFLEGQLGEEIDSSEEFYRLPQQLAVRNASTAGTAMMLILRYLPRRFNIVDWWVHFRISRRSADLEKLLSQVYALDRSNSAIGDLAARFVLALARPGGDAHPYLRTIAAKVVMANPQVEVNIGASSVNSQQVPGGLAHIRDLVEAGDLTGSVEKILEFGKHLYPKPEDYEAFNLRVTNLATTFRYAKKRNIFVNLLRILVPSVPSLASVSLVSFYLYQWTGSKLLATSTMAFTSTVGVKLMTELASMGKWMFGFGRYSRKMAEARQGLQAAVKDVLEHDPAYGAIFFSYFSQMAAREGSDLMQLFSEVIESALLERVLTGRDDEGHSRRAILHLAEQSVASGSLVGGIENLQGPLSATMFDLCRKSFSENVASRK